jgi:subtilase family serine protease
MRPHLRRLAPPIVALGAVAVLGLTPAAAAPGLPAAAGTSVPVCPGPAAPSDARCHARIRTDAQARNAVPAPAGVKASPDALGNNGAYDPGYLQNAYNLQSIASTGGAGTTVAIVDAYDDRTAASDLATYRSYFGLPAVNAGSGGPTFKKVNQNGGAGYPRPNSSWAQEIALDLDMVSAICPKCNILLVEASSNSYSNLAAAVNYAAGVPGVVAISNSYGGSESSGQTAYDNAYKHPGIAVTASSGDNGYGVEFPAASPYVTAVGGTTLNQASNAGGRQATETAWSGAGSGCSAYEAKPTWQTDAGCAKHRAVADVAAVADPNTGVWVFSNGGWYIFGGTSVASPITASVYALAGNAGTVTMPVNGVGGYASYSYANTGGLTDIASGSNGSCGTYLCSADAATATGQRYDGPTGNGTPNGVGAF